MINLPKTYSQWDKRWKNKLLGFSKRDTIGHYGCLITCQSMIDYYYGFNHKPDEVNDELKRYSGFAGSLYKWGSFSKVHKSIREIYKRTNYRLKNSDIKAIKESIDKNYPVMIWLDYNPRTVKNEMHWVLAIDYNKDNENDITIADPIDGKTKSMKKYLGWFIPSIRRTIEAYVIYEGKLPDLTNWKKKYEELLPKYNDLEKDKDKLEEIVNKIKKIIK
ncbi:MAG TPA: hypothetical protein ENH35_02905 [Candidatus Moranbacteria bacterium]|nr:hypothetical protein [Candidatus Pacearchaeota archaeon]HDZ85467.1 hypothetical protein [Candidatus Moranbacteria bacterium]